MSGDEQEHKAHPVRRQVLTALVYACAGALVIALVWAVFAIRTTQTSNSPILKSTQATAQDAKRAADAIQDCVEPSGECYKRGQAQTAKAVGDIGRVQMITLSCAFSEFRPGMSAEQLLAAIGPCVERLSREQTG